MTIEEAQNRILELETQLADVTSERDTLSQNNESLTTDLKNARELNQRYFERLNMGKAEETEEHEEPALSCEDFAKTLNIIK